MAFHARSTSIDPDPTAQATTPHLIIPHELLRLINSGSGMCLPSEHALEAPCRPPP